MHIMSRGSNNGKVVLTVNGAVNNDGEDVNGNPSPNSDSVGVLFLGDVDTEGVDRDDDLLNDGENDDDDDDRRIDNNDEIATAIRLGTTSSARFNILATMVGGGSLSLPLAFAKSGNILIGPVLLIVMAAMSEYCFRIMVETMRIMSYQNVNLGARSTKVGRDSFESMAATAFGPSARLFSMALVTSMCFFAIVAYAVLLRDILEPVTEIIYGPQSPGPSWRNNSLLWVVIFVVTPICTLRTLTSLKRFGAASMYSVFILGCCVLFRSVQCNLVESAADNDSWHHWTDSFRLWPERWWDLLDVFPLYISCFVCHYNISTVHNELNRPTVARVNWWLRSTTWGATLFYMVLGIAGSAYGAKCTATGHVQGNILLDFRNSDPLLLIGRTCLAVTISIAFPMLTIPARDILLRSLDSSMRRWRARATASSRFHHSNSSSSSSSNNNHNARPLTVHEAVVEDDDITEPTRVTSSSFRQPLLASSSLDSTPSMVAEQEATTPMVAADAPFWMRFFMAILLLWTATAVASLVKSIDTVWDLMGSSLSILLSVLIPAGSFLVITHREQVRRNEAESTPPPPTTSSTPPRDNGERGGGTRSRLDETTPLQEDYEEGHGVVYTPSASFQVFRCTARILIVIFIPLMFASMGNAIFHTFLEHA